MAQVQTKTNSLGAAATSIATTFTSNITAGNTIIVVSSEDFSVINQISSITDSLGNTYARAVADTEGSFVDGEIWYAPSPTGGANTVTINYAHSVVAAVVLAEYSGLLTSSPLDQVAKAHAITGTAMSSGASPATTQASELVIGGGMTNDTSPTTFTAGTGYGNKVQVVNTTSLQAAAIEDKTVSATGAQTATMTLAPSGHWVMLAATFKLVTSVTVTPNVASLTTSRFAPTILLPKTVIPSVRSLATSRFAPTVSVSNNQRVTPAIASLTTSRFATSISVSDNKVVKPPARSLSITTYAPSVVTPRQAVPSTKALTLTTYAPTVTATANRSVVIPAASLTVSRFAPTVTTSANMTVIPGRASLSLSTYAPTSSTPVTVKPAAAVLSTPRLAPDVHTPRQATPSTASITLTRLAPVVSATANRTVQVATASLTLTGQAPTVVVSSQLVVVPGVRAIAISTYAPTVVRPRTVVPGIASLTISKFAPRVVLPVSVTPSVLHLVMSAFPPTVSGITNPIAKPGTAALIVGFYAPTVLVLLPVGDGSAAVVWIPENEVTATISGGDDVGTGSWTPKVEETGAFIPGN